MYQSAGEGAMPVQVRRADPFVRTLSTRTPFHFGNVSFDEGAHLFLRVELAVDGRTEEGVAMAGLAPMWFLKDPSVTLAEGVKRMVETFEAAWTAAVDLDPAPTVFDLWERLYDRQEAWAADTDHPPLLWGYGVAVVEQAVLDAFCRATDTTFAAAVRENTLGIDLGRVYPELDGREPAELLPDEPTRSAAARHTVGLTDPLRVDDVAPADRLDDGLPQTLEEYVRADGVDHFKIKLAADADRDRARLAAVAALLADLGVDGYAVTLDANEGFADLAAFRVEWEALASDGAVDPLLDRLLYVEQPLARDAAFTPETRRGLREWDGAPPVIVDESDDRADSLAAALDCGYAGTSHKNCKGVFAGVANRCLVEHRRRADPDGEYVLSGEDLTTLGPVELVADLAVMGTLGLDHVERNGHHYYRGLSAFPDDVQDAVLDAHPDLFRRHECGFATLAVDGGRMRFDSAVDAPFGRAVALDPSRFTPLDEWSTRSLAADSR